MRLGMAQIPSKEPTYLTHVHVTTKKKNICYFSLWYDAVQITFIQTEER